MAKTVNITCDCCGKILYGQDRAARVKKPNVAINGQIVLQKVDPDTGYSYPIYITKSNNERMNFCDLVCLQEYVDYREKKYEDYRKDQLRAQATVEANERLLKGLD